MSHRYIARAHYMYCKMNSVINITRTSSCNRNRNSPSNRIRERIGNINHTHTSDHISKTMRIRKSIVNTRRLDFYYYYQTYCIYTK